MILFSFFAFADGPGIGILTFLGAVIFGGVGFLLYVIQFRLILEFFVANIRTAQNTGDLVSQADSDKE